jgi:hypothetical protein
MRKRSLLLGVFLVSFTASCGLRSQIAAMRTLADCEFRFEGVDRASLAGVDVLRAAEEGDLAPMELASIFTALALGRLPLDLTVRVGVRNPNDKAAALNRLDWVVLIDDMPMGTGTVTDRVEIAPRGGTASVPVHFSTDLVSALSGKSGESLIGFALNLAGAGERPSRVAVKIKPTVTVGGKAVRFPGTLTLTQKFSGSGSAL